MNGSLQGTASSSGDDDTSLSLVPTGRFKVELPKSLRNIFTSFEESDWSVT